MRRRAQCRTAVPPASMGRPQSPSTAARNDVVTTAVYAGSFDPITRGHEDLIRRSCEFVDHLIVAVAVNSAKKALFTTEERVELIRLSTTDQKCVEVTQFEGLLVDFARKVGASLNIRGLRVVREVAKHHGSLTALVHPAVAEALAKKFAHNKPSSPAAKSGKKGPASRG